MPKQIYKESIVAGPFNIYFCNSNTAMGLKGHCHYAKVYFTFRTVGLIGFPSFEHTHAEIQLHLTSMTSAPFRSSTNEDVLRQIFSYFQEVELKEVQKYRSEFELFAMELHVRGVPDAIGHADSFTIYRIQLTS